MGYVISKMTDEDVESVFEIEKELLGTADISSIISSFKSNVLCYYVLKKEDEVVGFFEVSMIKPDCELYDIAIKKEYQGLKLSKLLMDYLFKLCRENQYETIFLEVNSINNKAINLYKKYGFEEYLIRKNYYGKFDAILMKAKV